MLHPPLSSPSSQPYSYSGAQLSSPQSSVQSSPLPMAEIQPQMSSPSSPLPMVGAIDRSGAWSNIDESTKDEIKGCGIILAFIAILLFSVLLGASFQYCQYDQVCFKRAIYGSTDTHTVLPPGRHYMLPGLYELVKFQSTYQSVSFLNSNNNDALSVFSLLGVQFSVDIVFFFRINPATLAQTYKQYNTEYPTQVENYARATIKNVCPMFTIEQFANDRVTVQRTIGTALHAALAEQVYIDVESVFFILNDVYLPATLAATNLDSALALQENALSASQQTLQLISLETSVLVEEIYAQSNLTWVDAQNTANQLVQNSVSQAGAIVQAATGQGLQATANTLNLTRTNNELLLQFYELASVSQASSPRLFVNGAQQQPLYTVNV